MTTEAHPDQQSDHREVEGLIFRYARAIDTRDYPLLDTCFCTDSMLDFSAVGGPKDAYPAVRKWLQEVLEPLLEMQHIISNVSLSLGGPEPSGTCYTLNINGMPNTMGGGHTLVGAMYTDTYVRTREGWRISTRGEIPLTQLNIPTATGRA